MPFAKWFYPGTSLALDGFGQESFSSDPSYNFYLYSSYHVALFPTANGS